MKGAAEPLDWMCVVKSCGRLRNWLWLWITLGLAASAWPQVKVGDSTLSANGNAGVGYTATYDGQDLSTIAFSLNGTVNGTYHDPRFLNWTVSPYLNQSNLNSNYSSYTNASGVSAVANFLSGSRTPISFAYAYDHNTEGNSNVPGQIGPYKTVGNGQTIGMTAAWLPEDLPSIQGGFTHSDTNYQIIGEPESGTADVNAFNIGSSYEIGGTNLFGSYAKTYLNTDAPSFANPGISQYTNANVGTWLFGASRQLTSKSYFSANYSHSNLDATYAGTEAIASFNNVSALVGYNPTERLTLDAHMNYSSNLSAQYFTTIVNAGTPSVSGSTAQAVSPSASAGANATTRQQQGLSYTTDYLNYGTTATYLIARNWTVNGTFTRQVQGQPAGLPDVTSNIFGVTTTYTHLLWGGSFGASYGLNYYYAPVFRAAADQPANAGQNSTFLGQSGAVSYSRVFWGWTGSASGSYARSLTTVLVGYTQYGYTANGSLSRTVGQWNLALSASYANTHVENINISNAISNSYNASLSRRWWGVSGGYSQSSGTGFQIGNVLVPVSVGQVLPQFLVQYNGEAYSVGANIHPVRRWNISGSYSHVRYDSQNISGFAKNFSDQAYVRSEYFWRQLTFNAGYSYISQGLGASLTNPSNRPAQLQTVFFGVTRRFDFF
jgi:hypothetical protein